MTYQVKSKAALRLGRRIRAIRKSTGQTLRIAAKAAGTNNSQLCRIENGMIEPSIKRFRAIAKALDVSLTYLLDEPQPCSICGIKPQQ